MSRLGIPFLVVLALLAAGCKDEGAPPAKASKPARNTPRDVAQAFARAMEVGDAKGASAYISLSRPEDSAMLDALTSYLFAFRQVRDTARGKFGDSLRGLVVDREPDLANQLRQSAQQGDEQSATLVGQGHGVTFKMRNTDKGWKVDGIGGIELGGYTSLLYEVRMVDAQSDAVGKLLAGLRRRIEGKVQTPVLFQQQGATRAEVRMLGTPDDEALATIKRLIRGAGILEFHILITDLSAAPARAMVARLQAKGPAPAPGDTMRWYAVDRPEALGSVPLESHAGRQWALASVKPEDSMTHQDRAKPWQVESVAAEMEGDASAIRFKLNPAGAKLLEDLTGRSIGKPLAIVLDGRILSAPTLRSALASGECIIAGAFPTADIDSLTRILKAGPLPARLTDEPVFQQTIPRISHADAAKAAAEYKAMAEGLSALGGEINSGRFTNVYDVCRAIAARRSGSAIAPTTQPLDLEGDEPPAAP